MNKNFEQEVLDSYFKQNQKLDPYVFATPEVDQYLKQINALINTQFLVTYLASNVILAPLQTITTSLQLSVQKHQNIYQTQQARTKELAKLNTEMTVHEKRKFQLMIKTGGKTTPYTAPVYNGYKETFNGLKSQGWKAFFKGLGFRSISSGIYFYPFAMTSILISTDQVKQGPLFHYLKLCGQCLLLDIFSNPLHVMQNRYILQNRIPQFRSIRKPFKTAQRLAMQGELFRGAGFYFINNIVGFATRIPMYLSIVGNSGINYNLYGLFVLGQFITYPFSTAFKRLQCQTERIPGMIPVRYSGLFHALRVIGYEQGVKGLWRGFSLHTVQTLLRLKFLQFFNSSPIKSQ